MIDGFDGFSGIAHHTVCCGTMVKPEVVTYFVQRYFFYPLRKAIAIAVLQSKCRYDCRRAGHVPVSKHAPVGICRLGFFDLPQLAALGHRYVGVG